MSKFIVVSCVDLSEEEDFDVDYDGPVVIFSDINDPSFMLFFPVTVEQAATINSVMENEELSYDINTCVLGIYKTMIDSWKASNKYLAGILMDVGYNVQTEEDIMEVHFALSNSDGGYLDGVVKVSFIHAVLVSVLNRVPILITDKMLERLMPPEEEQNVGNVEGSFPEDQEILNIVKSIMSGKVQED